MVAWAEEARYFVDRQFMVDDLERCDGVAVFHRRLPMRALSLMVKPLLGIDADG